MYTQNGNHYNKHKQALLKPYKNKQYNNAIYK